MPSEDVPSPYVRSLQVSCATIQPGDNSTRAALDGVQYRLQKAIARALSSYWDIPGLSLSGFPIRPPAGKYVLPKGTHVLLGIAVATSTRNRRCRRLLRDHLNTALGAACREVYELTAIVLEVQIAITLDDDLEPVAIDHKYDREAKSATVNKG